MAAQYKYPTGSWGSQHGVAVEDGQVVLLRCTIRSIDKNMVRWSDGDIWQRIVTPDPPDDGAGQSRTDQTSRSFRSAHRKQAWNEPEDTVSSPPKQSTEPQSNALAHPRTTVAVGSGAVAARGGGRWGGPPVTPSWQLAFSGDPLLAPPTDEALRELFDALDTDRKGYIRENELQAFVDPMMDSLGMDSGCGVRFPVRRILSTFRGPRRRKPVHEDKISFDEFAVVMLHLMAR